MFEFMKIIHMLALMGGGAAMIGNGLLMVKVMRAGAPPPPMVAQTMKILGMTGLTSIVLLWLTGAYMSALGAYPIGWEYGLKLLGALLVLLAVGAMSWMSMQAEKAGTPPDLRRMKQLASIARGGVLLAIVFGVTAFN